MSMEAPPKSQQWEHEGAHEVAGGVYRIPLPLPQDALRAVNVYAIIADDGVVMVDAGWALDASRRRLEDALGSLNRDLADINRFLVTHLHRDHYTQAIVIRRTLGTRVSLGIGESISLDEVLTHPEDIVPRQLLSVLRAHGAGALVDRIIADHQLIEHIDVDSWERPDDWLTPGEHLALSDRSLRVIHTPGHTRGHVVFHDPGSNLLFAGDHVLPHITPSIGFESAPVDSPLSAYLSSLEAMLALPDARLLPAHGPVMPSVHDRVRNLQEHHRIRLEQTHSAVAAGSATAFDVAKALRWTRRERAFEELDLFNQMIATNETIAHLKVLREQGAVREEHLNGVTAYLT